MSCTEKGLRKPGPSISLNPDTHTDLSTFPMFSLHYDSEGGCNVKHVLDSIVRDLSSHTPIHNWDERLVNDSVKEMAEFANQELIRSEWFNGSYVLTYAVVAEVSIINGMNKRHYVPEGYFPNATVSFLLSKGGTD